jgi:hypothetical protein
MDTERLQKLASRLEVLRSRKFVLKYAEGSLDPRKQIGKDGYTAEQYRRDMGTWPYTLVLEPELEVTLDGTKGDMEDMARAMTEFLQSEYRDVCIALEEEIRQVALKLPEHLAEIDDGVFAASQGYGQTATVSIREVAAVQFKPQTQPSEPGSEYPAARYHQLDPGIKERTVNTAEESTALGPDWGPLPFTDERARLAALASIDLSVCRSCGGEAKPKILKSWRGKPMRVQVLCAACRKTLKDAA